MLDMLFTVILCLTAAGAFDNAPNVWKVAIAILMTIIEVMLLYKEHQQEELQDRVKILENRVKEMVVEDK